MQIQPTLSVIGQIREISPYFLRILLNGGEGYWVAYAANRTISKNWSPTVDKTQKQNLVTSGVYSTIRHPLYLSGLLILVGTNIYFGSSWAWVGVLLVLIVILIRLPIEERHLAVRFGQEYITYRERTKAILPWMV